MALVLAPCTQEALKGSSEGERLDKSKFLLAEDYCGSTDTRDVAPPYIA